MNAALQTIKKFLKKFWFTVWKDNSLKGWVIAILFFFVFIKLIFFPFLNLVTGTTLPLAIVESCSMYHQANVFSSLDNWWQRHEDKYSGIGIDKQEFSGFTFRRGFSKGDILFIIKAKPEKLKPGDIIIFNSGTKKTPIIHRIISISQKNGEYVFSTMGDNNPSQITLPNSESIDETAIHESQLVGKAVLRIVPYVGWAKLVFFEHLRIPAERGFCSEK